MGNNSSSLQSRPDILLNVAETKSLMPAAEIEKISKLIDSIIKFGRNINKKNSQGLTPLMLAANFGHTSGVKTLIMLNTTVDLADNNGQTALMLASNSGQKKTF
ncbi:ankyrin repeat domain-containing protein 50 [Biomphalaria glabrata]|nr:ankyrin repeat domain-containing protein 50-like [Biomphalaria glabrata]